MRKSSQAKDFSSLFFLLCAGAAVDADDAALLLSSFIDTEGFCVEVTPEFAAALVCARGDAAGVSGDFLDTCSVSCNAGSFACTGELAGFTALFPLSAAAVATGCAAIFACDVSATNSDVYGHGLRVTFASGPSNAKRSGCEIALC